MYHIKDDQRAIRSAEAIYAALVSLMEEQSFAAIKVTEIVAQAQVARATFYRAFDVQEDVLRWRCDQILDELFAYVTRFAKSQPRTASNALLKPILRFFYLDSTFIKLLIQAERVDILQGAFQMRLEQLGRKVVAVRNVPEDYLDYWFALRAAAVVSMLVQWVKEGKQPAPDELAEGIAELTREMSQANLLV